MQGPFGAALAQRGRRAIGGEAPPTIVIVVAIYHFIPAFLLPFDILLSANPMLLLVPLALFVFLS
jgi:hypothetical protein